MGFVFLEIKIKHFGFYFAKRILMID